MTGDRDRITVQVVCEAAESGTVTPAIRPERQQTPLGALAKFPATEKSLRGC